MLLAKRAAAVSLTLLITACGGASDPPPSDPGAPHRVALPDDAITNEGESVLIDVLANDRMIMASTLTIAVPPSEGTATVHDGGISYTPPDSFFGTTSFTYRVNATTGDELQATVSVTVNARPVAADVELETIENELLPLSELVNASSDPDSTLTDANITIVDTANGDVFIEDDHLTYLPDEDFTGADTITFRITDNNGADSSTATAFITVLPVTETAVVTRELPVPASEYVAMNNPSFESTVLSSPLQPAIRSTNGVSLLITLSGADAGREDGLLIVDVIPPSGGITSLRRDVIVCDEALCSAYLPRLPRTADIVRGEWQFRLGTTASTTSEIDFTDLRLRVVERRGPDLSEATESSAITVRPWLTATSVSDQRFDEILSHLNALGESNDIDLRVRPPVRLDNPLFVEVSSRFTDPETQELIRHGEPDAVNIFFVESFTGSGGRIGIAPGIPGELTARDSYLNGIIINSTVTQDDPDIHARTTAEFAFHELGHILGLFHTTEADFTHDILDDTAECLEAHDMGNGRPDAHECPDGLNIMFWNNDLGSEKDPLTQDQSFVIERSPLATREGPPRLE